jgi:DNA-binding CsgD family transcriptional regulator
LKQAEVREVAQTLFSGYRSPFGAFSIGSETHRTTTMPDAVRRCRWIAVDVNAASFALFFAGASADRTQLLPCFDSQYPGIAAETRSMVGEQGLDMVKHARISTVPCWWNDGPGCASSEAFEQLDWCKRIGPLGAATCGIAFPVQAERARCGVVAFMGPNIALPPVQLFEIHARCFTLFDAVTRIRAGDGAKFPAISKRELECLKLTANGYTSEDIARLLKLSVHTANQYLTNTAHKLDAVNRMQAVAKALRMGLIE